MPALELEIVDEREFPIPPTPKVENTHVDPKAIGSRVGLVAQREIRQAVTIEVANRGQGVDGFRSGDFDGVENPNRIASRRSGSQEQQPYRARGGRIGGRDRRPHRGGSKPVYVGDDGQRTPEGGSRWQRRGQNSVRDHLNLVDGPVQAEHREQHRALASECARQANRQILDAVSIQIADARQNAPQLR